MSAILLAALVDGAHRGTTALIDHLPALLGLRPGCARQLELACPALSALCLTVEVSSSMLTTRFLPAR
jgi:hypothetical protein